MFLVFSLVFVKLAEIRLEDFRKFPPLCSFVKILWVFLVNNCTVVGTLY